MVEVLKKCFPDKVNVNDGEWTGKLKEMIPSYGKSLIDDPALCLQLRAETAAVLNIKDIA